MLSDLRFAFRSLAKSPGFAVVAIASLALGIGANTAVFSLVNAILLSSLPVPAPQELRVIRWSGTETKLRGMVLNGHFQRAAAAGSQSRDARPDTAAQAEGRDRGYLFPYPFYRGLREHGAAQAELCGYTELEGINARTRGAAFTAAGLMVSDNFFATLGVHPVIGRLFAAGEDQPGAAPLALISYDWWDQQFAFDPGVLGQTVTLNGGAFTIVGVLPRGFRGVSLVDRPEFVVPMSAQPLVMPGWATTSTKHWWVHLLARMRPGAQPAQLQAALDVAFAGQVADLMQAPKVEVVDGHAGPDFNRSLYRRPLLILLSVVGIVMLVACANLAGLLLARGAARQHEFAMRAALGASRWRLIRQSLVESLVLALAGGALGAVVALWGQLALSRLFAGSADGLHYDLSLDLTVLGFTSGLSLLAAGLAGLLPALRAGRVDPGTSLKSRTAACAARGRGGQILVAAQIALTVLLLAGAGLYVRTLVNLVRIDPGFATGNLLLFKVDPHAAGLRGGDIADFYTHTQAALEQIPGVRGVALTQGQLLSGWMGYRNFSLPAHPQLAGEPLPGARVLTVGETFFTTMGIPLQLGRGFTAADAADAPKVAIVNETFVRSYFAHEHPLGQTFRLGDDEWSIVGICRDAKYEDIKGAIQPTVYFSYRQIMTNYANFAVRTALPPLAIVGAVRKAIAGVNPNVPLANIATQKAVRDGRIAQEIMFASLVSALAGLAVLLAGIGLYGLLAYQVARRTAEFGIRMALGATPQAVARPILREALLLAGVGLIIGVPVALALTQVIKSQLYGVAPTDPLTLLLAALGLAGVAMLAAWLPARRATRVDPMIALRAD